MNDKKIAIIIIVIILLGVFILNFALRSYFSKQGYDLETIKFKSGMFEFVILTILTIVGYLFLKLKFRQKDK
jgi:amino acid permease